MGDCISVPLAKGQLPKAGVFAEAHGRVAARNIVADIQGGAGAEFDGRGYCFVADVKKAAPAEPVAERGSIKAASQPYQRTDSRKSGLPLILLAGIGIVGLGFAVYYLWPARTTTVSTAPAGSTPTDPRYVAACGQVKPVIPRVFHRLVDRIVGTRSVRWSSQWALSP